jgi:predicted metalloprotease with PDZ domain
LNEFGRKIRLEKDETDGLNNYGFNFRISKSEGLHVITNITIDTPAFAAGIRNGDYLLEVSYLEQYLNIFTTPYN